MPEPPTPTTTEDRTAEFEAAKAKFSNAPVPVDDVHYLHGALIGFGVNNGIAVAVLRCGGPSDPSDDDSPPCSTEIEVPLPFDIPAEEHIARLLLEANAIVLELPDGKCPKCTQALAGEAAVPMVLLCGTEVIEYAEYLQQKNATDAQPLAPVVPISEGQKDVEP
jgi:hypothetical protein